MKFTIALFTLALSSATAFSQELGILGGFHQTTAETSATGYSEDGKIGFKLGGIARFEMTAPFSFRSGLVYSQRPFDLTSSGGDISYKFAYLDVPALIDYKLNEIVGFYGGLSIAINVSDKIDPDGGDPDAESMIPLAQLGASFLFQDMFSLDVYYERGFGDIAEDVENYSTFGANFIYWIY